MMRPNQVMRIALLATSVAMVSGCAETELFSFYAKKAVGDQSPSADSTGATVYKVGKPYQVAGIWYYPHEDFEYDETGIASYYAEQFHGKLTADGEQFDMNAVTAAHKTLPLPSVVRVTNLENGRSLVVRINDRGPFVNGRIIDLSRRSAQLLGMERQGTARVRVQILADESHALASSLRHDSSAAEPKIAAAPRTGVSAEPLPGSKSGGGKSGASTQAAAPEARPQAASSVGRVEQEPVRNTSLFVQVGAFSRYDNAQRLSAKLAGIGTPEIQQAHVKGQTIYRVRIGPAASVEEADRLLDRVNATGQQDARVVVD